MPDDVPAPPQRLVPADATMRATLDANHDCVKLIGLDGRLEYLNSPGACMLGIDATDARGQPWAALWPPETHGLVQESIAAAAAGQTARFEAERTSPAGPRTWAVTVAPVWGASGQIERVLAVSQDVTEARRNALRLNEAEGILAALGAASPDPLFAKDRSGRMIYANAATLAAIGRPPDQVLGRTDAEYLADLEEATALMETDRRIMATGQPETVLEQVRPASSGNARLFESTKSPLRDPATNQIIGLAGIARDITDRRIAAEKDARLAAIVNSSADAMIGFAADDGHIMSWNAAAERLFGWTEAEAIGAPVTLLLPPNDDGRDQGGVFGPVMAGEQVPRPRDRPHRQARPPHPGRHHRHPHAGPRRHGPRRLRQSSATSAPGSPPKPHSASARPAGAPSPRPCPTSSGPAAPTAPTTG